MKEAALWAALLAGYGQTLTLRDGAGERQVKAFFQPVAEKEPDPVPSPLGLGPAGKYLYLGPPGESLEGLLGLTCRGRPFRLLRSRPYCLGQEPLYRWAIFEEEEGEA